MNIKINLMSNAFEMNQDFARKILNEFTGCDEFQDIECVANDYQFRIKVHVLYRDQLKDYEIFGTYNLDQVSHEVSFEVFTECMIRIYKDASNLTFNKINIACCGATCLDDCSDCENSGNCDYQDELTYLF